ncbi:helix-turn-helix domain-containing protein [Sinomicrobium weinanense]|uniref:Helix-turn-helix domain-containing protein n=1 Tax=Sinomicrobium weinanense TaxID=2842200 RepID=A0A926Q2E7_9FLAO|nr:helix-turn-helix domain-containing protein [Sinomicrobium weinanense]MBC9794831.1 helix-turn-helix domain-containing protein [Sinomicrobium weinanense]MBU3125602.1 helix-turn-helix domain-containing protein [Sinomicrobium weinanense]
MKYNTIETTKESSPAITLKRDCAVDVTLLLKKLKNHLGIQTNIELSRVLDVKPNTISTWKRRNSLDYELIISICNMLDIDLNALFSTAYTRNRSVQSILAVPIEAQYQYVSNYHKEEFLDKMPKCSLPFSFSSPDTRAFQMAGISMSPTLKEGAYVIGEKISDREKIEDNTICVLISKLRGIHINRVTKDPNNPYILNLLNDNENFSNNIVMPIEEVAEAWGVTSTLALDNIKRDH